MNEQLATIVMYGAPIVAAAFIAFLYANVFVKQGIYLVTYFPIINIVATPFLFLLFIHALAGYLVISATIALGIITYGYWNGIKKRRAKGYGTVNAWVSFVLTLLLFLGMPIGSHYYGKDIRQDIITGNKSTEDICTSQHPEYIILSIYMGMDPEDDVFTAGNKNCDRNFNKAGALLEEGLQTEKSKGTEEKKSTTDDDENWDDSDLPQAEGVQINKSN